MAASLSRVDLPLTPPFAIRARILTPLDAGGSMHETDGLLEVDADGRIGFVGPAMARSGAGAAAAGAAGAGAAWA